MGDYGSVMAVPCVTVAVPWVAMGDHGSVMSCHMRSWQSHGLSWVVMGCHGLPWVAVSYHGRPMGDRGRP